MNTKTFNAIIKDQVNRSLDLLTVKAKEYTIVNEDRLTNFKTAAALQHKTTEQALSGMMAKHIVSIYDMINSGQEYPIEVWDEKITDSINYLLLLSAVVKEE